LLRRTCAESVIGAQTMALQACMQKNREYYGDMLEAQEPDGDNTDGPDGSSEALEQKGAEHSATHPAAGYDGAP
jgi:hypothetical protein